MRKLSHALGLAGLVSVACGGPAGVDLPGFSFEDLPDGGQPDGAPFPIEADLLAEAVTGDHAIRLVVASIARIPPFGTERPSTTTTLSTGHIRRAGDAFELIETGCRATSSDAELTIPDALTRSVGETVSPLRFGKDGENRTKFVRAEGLVVIGARLSTPDEPLPAEENDPRVFDQDGDGKPGVTVRKSGFPSGDIYVVQRQRASYGGVLVGEGRLEGNVVSSVEQKMIGASSSLLKIDVPSWQDPDLSKSTIVMVRQPEPISCETLIAKSAEIFRE